MKRPASGPLDEAFQSVRHMPPAAGRAAAVAVERGASFRLEERGHVARLDNVDQRDFGALLATGWLPKLETRNWSLTLGWAPRSVVAPIGADAVVAA